MDIYGQIAMKIKELAGKGNSSASHIFSAKVKSVESQTCTVMLDDLAISDVRLKSVINSNTDALIIKPKVNSVVMIADLSAGQYRELLVISYSEIDVVNLKISNTQLKIDQSGVEINSGNLGGMVKINELVQWMQNLHSDLTNLKTLLASHPVVGNSAPLGLPFIMLTSFPQKSMFENQKVKQ